MLSPITLHTLRFIYNKISQAHFKKKTNSHLCTSTKRDVSLHSSHRMASFDPTARWDDPRLEEYLSNSLGPSRLREISSALVKPPLTTCIRVNTQRNTPEELFKKLSDAVPDDDKFHLFNNQNNTTVIPTSSSSSSSPPGTRDEKKVSIHPQLPAILIQGDGPHTIDYSPTTKTGLEVIVGRKAGESILRGSNCYAPGILATTQGICQGDLVAVSVGLEPPGSNNYAISRGTVLPRNIPLDDDRFPGRRKQFIGIARAEVPRTGLCPSKSGLVLTMVKRVYRLPSLGDSLPGDFMLQNLPSLVAAWVLNPRPGSRVLDMCAAPGGKTTALAELMGDNGEIVALDRSNVKVVGIDDLAKKHGLKSIVAMKADSINILTLRSNDTDAAGGGAGGGGGAAGDKEMMNQTTETMEVNEKVRQRQERIRKVQLQHGYTPKPSTKAPKCPGFPPELFDYILLDAPCTALGLRPRFVVPTTLDELIGTSQYQRKLLDTAVQLLKPGGYLVYSTCSFSPIENESNVRYVLDKYASCMKLVPQEPHIGQHGLTGTMIGKDGEVKQLLTEEESKLVQRFDPSHELDTIGFFISKFEKTAQSLVEY